MLTYNRLVHRVFTTDCMNTLFFKSLPTITVAEMRGDLPSTDSMFEAANPTEYEQLIATPAGPEQLSGSLKDLMTLFLGEHWPTHDSPDLAVVKPEHLMSVIFGRAAPILIPLSTFANRRQPCTPSSSFHAPPSSCHRRAKFWSAQQVGGKSSGKP
jgi:hypothetical protein